MKKNSILTLLIILGAFFFNQKVFSYSIVPNPAYNDVEYTLSSDITGNYWACLYSPNGENNNNYFGCIQESSEYKLDRLSYLNYSGVYHFVVLDDTASDYASARSGTYNEAILSNAYIADFAYDFTATPTPVTYSLSYSSDENGSINGITSQTIISGESGSEVTAVPDDNYHFVNWSDASTANPRIDTNVTASKSVTATFAINQYTITFNSDGGSEVDSITEDYGATVVAPTTPIKTGYTFSGWAPALPATMPKDGAILIAQWIGISSSSSTSHGSSGGFAQVATPSLPLTPVITPTPTETPIRVVIPKVTSLATTIITKSVTKLFDIVLTIENALLNKSSDLIAHTQFTSFGTVPTLVNMVYRIEDASGKEVYTENTNVTVETEQLVTKEFKNLNIKDGKYTLFLTTTYGASVTDEFKQVFEVKTPIAPKKGTATWYIVAGLVVVIGGFEIYMLRRRKIENNRNEKIFN
jgi:hypothetical protein